MGASCFGFFWMSSRSKKFLCLVRILEHIFVFYTVPHAFAYLDSRLCISAYECKRKV